MRRKVPAERGVFQRGFASQIGGLVQSTGKESVNL